LTIKTTDEGRNLQPNRKTLRSKTKGSKLLYTSIPFSKNISNHVLHLLEKKKAIFPPVS